MNNKILLFALSFSMLAFLNGMNPNHSHQYALQEICKVFLYSYDGICTGKARVPSPEQIKRDRKKALMKYHPDKCPDHELAEKNIRIINDYNDPNELYEQLSEEATFFAHRREAQERAARAAQREREAERERQRYATEYDRYDTYDPWQNGRTYYDDPFERCRPRGTYYDSPFERWRRGESDYQRRAGYNAYDDQSARWREERKRSEARAREASERWEREAPQRQAAAREAAERWRREAPQRAEQWRREAPQREAAAREAVKREQAAIKIQALARKFIAKKRTQKYAVKEKKEKRNELILITLAATLAIIISLEVIYVYKMHQDYQLEDDIDDILCQSVDKETRQELMKIRKSFWYKHLPLWVKKVVGMRTDWNATLSSCHQTNIL